MFWLYSENPAQVKFFFTASYADDTKWIGTEITRRAPAACVLLISATFRSALNHRASVWIFVTDFPMHSFAQ